MTDEDLLDSIAKRLSTQIGSRIEQMVFDAVKQGTGRTLYLKTALERFAEMIGGKLYDADQIPDSHATIKTKDCVYMIEFGPRHDEPMLSGFKVTATKAEYRDRAEQLSRVLDHLLESGI